MNWVTQAISDFGRSIGLPNLALDDDHRLQLLVEDDGILMIQHIPEIALPEVVVSRIEPLRFSAPSNLRQALRCADFRIPNTWPVQVGATDNQLLIAIRIPERAFVMNALEQALTHLDAIHNKIIEKN